MPNERKTENRTAHWLRKKTSVLIIGTVVLLLVGTCLYRTLPGLNATRQVHVSPNAEGSTNANKVFPGTVAKTNTVTTADQSTERAKELTSELLYSKAGHITGKRAWDCLMELKALGGQAKPTIDGLVISTNANERLLGVFLTLEVLGPSNSVLDVAARDPAPVVPAEVSHWLYFNSRFDQRDGFLNQVAMQLSPPQKDSIFSVCDRVPVSVEVPAGLSILCIGRGLPLLLAEVVRRSPSLAADMKRHVLDPATPVTRRLSLLDVMRQSRPEGYADALTNLISQNAMRSPVRFQAARELGEIGADANTLAFLEAASANLSDPLAPTLKVAASKVQKRTLEGDAPLQRLGEALEQAIRAREAGNAQTNLTALFEQYVEAAMKNDWASPDPTLLLAAKQEVQSKAFSDYSQRKRLADTEYLLWKATQPTNSNARGAP